jgi:GPH family glycoside/pentoside/hexuronide:cation symporter
MLVGSLLMGASFWMLLAPPRGSVTVTVFWLVAATFLFRSTSALFRIPYLGLGAELSADYHGRTVVVGVRSIFGLCGTLLAAALSFPLFFPNTIPGLDPKLAYEGYPRLGLAAGALMTATGLIATAGTWKWSRRAAPVRDVAVAVQRGYLAGMKLALANAAFRRVWLSLAIFFFAVVLNAVMAIQFFTWYVRIADSTVLSRIQLAFYAGAIAGVPCWIAAARRRDKREVAMAAVAATAVLLGLATLLFGDGRTFGTGQAVPLVLGHALAGLAASAVWVLPGSMVADVADEDAFAHGARREGFFFGMLNLGEKIGAGLALLAGGALLQYFVRVAPGAVPDNTAIARIGLSYGLLPAVVLLIAVAPLLSYPLSRRRVEDIQRQLQGQTASAMATDDESGLPAVAPGLRSQTT